MLCLETFVRQVLWLIIDRFGEAACSGLRAGWLHSTAHCLVTESVQAWLNEHWIQKLDIQGQYRQAP